MIEVTVLTNACAAGLDDAVEDALRERNGLGLERRILAIHRLKTAVPARALARMGAIAGGGSDAQIDVRSHCVYMPRMRQAALTPFLLAGRRLASTLSASVWRSKSWTTF